MPDAVLKAMTGQPQGPQLPSMGSVSRMKVTDEQGFKTPARRKTVTFGDALMAAKVKTGESQKARRGSRFRCMESDGEESVPTRLPMIGAVSRPTASRTDRKARWTGRS